VPPDLKESFQRQLLQQDFVTGRRITCGVLRVNPKPSSRADYGLQLLFEELGPIPVGADDFTSETLPSSIDQDDDDDIAEDDGDVDSGDVKEIFDELRGNAPLLSSENLFAWGDLADMIQEGVISRTDIVRAVSKAGVAKSGSMSLEQFEEIVELLQDAMDGISDLDETDDDSDAVTPVNSKSEITVNASESVGISENDDETDLDSEPVDLETALKEAFDELKSAKGTVSLSKFKGASTFS
jgi:hypothetical protein